MNLSVFYILTVIYSFLKGVSDMDAASRFETGLFIIQVLELWPGVSQSAVWYRHWYSNNVNHHIINFWKAGTPYPFVWNIKETGLSYKYRNAQLEHILLGGGGGCWWGSVANACPAASTTTGNFLAAKWQIEQWTLQFLRKLLDLKWQQVHSLWVFICSPFSLYIINSCIMVKCLNEVGSNPIKWLATSQRVLGKLLRTIASSGQKRPLFCSLSETCNFFVMFLAKMFLCRSIKFISVIFYTKPTSLWGVDLNTHILNCWIIMMLATDWRFNCVTAGSV